jgi:hypothetical protein
MGTLSEETTSPFKTLLHTIFVFNAEPIYTFLIVYIWCYSGTKSTLTADSYCRIVPPWMIDGDDCEAVCRMNECQGTKPVAVPLSTTDPT